MLHAEISGDAVDEHSVIGGHGGEPVTGAFDVANKGDHVLFDTQQRHPVFVVAVQRLDNKVLQINPRVVRVQMRADCADVDVAGAIGQFGARVSRQRERDKRTGTIDTAL